MLHSRYNAVVSDLFTIHLRKTITNRLIKGLADNIRLIDKNLHFS